MLFRNCSLPAQARPVIANRVAIAAPARSRVVLRVAALEEPQSSERDVQPPVTGPLSAAGLPVQPVAADLDIQELELEELDSAQEQVLSWLVSHTEAEQEEDLDEMVDYDEFGDEEYEDLVEEVERLVHTSGTPLSIGDRVVGTVYEVDDEGAYVDIGQKASGFVPLAECSFAKLKTPLEVLRVGMTREFIVLEREDSYGQVVLSLAVLEAGVFWQRIRQLQEEDHPVSVRVESANKGGLLVKYGPYQGFIPVSQFGPTISVDDMEGLIGRDITVMFLEVDEARERLVFSIKRAVSASNLSLNAQSYKSGDLVTGVVQSIKPYGAFVDIGNGMTGLLHVSQISSQRVMNLDKVLQEGDKIKVLVLSADLKQNRVMLSTRHLESTAGEMLTNPQKVFEQAEASAARYRTLVSAAQQQVTLATDPPQTPAA